MIPYVIPGIVLAIGFLAAYTRPPLALYGTAWIMIFAFTSCFLPIAYTNSDTALRSVHPELEDAARIAGAGRVVTLWEVTLPLVKRGVFAGWLLVLIAALRELSTAIFLFSANTKVMSTVLIDLSEEGDFERLAPPAAARAAGASARRAEDLAALPRSLRPLPTMSRDAGSRAFGDPMQRRRGRPSRLHRDRPRGQSRVPHRGRDQAAAVARMYVPIEYGGLETDPITSMQVVEAVAEANAAAAWNLMIGATYGISAAFLPKTSARDLRCDRRRCRRCVAP